MVDELSLGLAPVVVQQLFGMLKEINRDGTTILLVEQYVNQALRIAHRAYVLEKGTVTIEGSAASLLESSDVVQASYMGGHAHAGNGDGAAPAAAPAPKRKPRTRKPTAKSAARSTSKRASTVVTPGTESGAADENESN
jgi:branched-chain amino acid transport system ATP-binding protein